jgi:hypothetical protein
MRVGQRLYAFTAPPDVVSNIVVKLRLDPEKPVPIPRDWLFPSWWGADMSDSIVYFQGMQMQLWFLPHTSQCFILDRSGS